MIIVSALMVFSLAAPSGEEVYAKCLACHSLERNRTGPKHCGLFGRVAGTVPDYDYSKAMKSSKVTWNEKTLDAFLQSPLEYIPGTKMGFAGVKDKAERQALVRYLKRATSSSSEACRER